MSSEQKAKLLMGTVFLIALLAVLYTTQLESPTGAATPLENSAVLTEIYGIEESEELPLTINPNAHESPRASPREDIYSIKSSTTIYLNCEAKNESELLALGNEVIEIYNQRRQAIGDDPLDNITTCEEFYDLNLWRGMQTWMSDNLNDFANYDESVAGSFHLYSFPSKWDASSAGGIPRLNESAWLDLAGIPDGFRRAEEDWNWDVGDYYGENFTYGYAVGGDLMGPWILDDIQKAFHVLNWTVRSSSVGIDTEIRSASDWNSTCSDARIEVIGEYNDNSWSSYSDNVAKVWAGQNGQSSLWWYTGRIRGKFQIDEIYSNASHEADLYFFTYNESADTEPDYFCDIDSLGMEGYKAWFYETHASAAVDTRTSSLFSPSETCPLAISGPACGPNYMCEYVAAPIWVLKWDFDSVDLNLTENETIGNFTKGAPITDGCGVIYLEPNLTQMTINVPKEYLDEHYIQEEPGDVDYIKSSGGLLRNEFCYDLNIDLTSPCADEALNTSSLCLAAGSDCRWYSKCDDCTNKTEIYGIITEYDPIKVTVNFTYAGNCSVDLFSDYSLEFDVKSVIKTMPLTECDISADGYLLCSQVYGPDEMSLERGTELNVNVALKKEAVTLTELTSLVVVAAHNLYLVSSSGYSGYQVDNLITLNILSDFNKQLDTSLKPVYIEYMPTSTLTDPLEICVFDYNDIYDNVVPGFEDLDTLVVFNDSILETGTLGLAGCSKAKVNLDGTVTWIGSITEEFQPKIIHMIDDYHPGDPNYVLLTHELGHSLAKLCDEYFYKSWWPQHKGHPDGGCPNPKGEDGTAKGVPECCLEVICCEIAPTPPYRLLWQYTWFDRDTCEALPTGSVIADSECLSTPGTGPKPTSSLTAGHLACTANNTNAALIASGNKYPYCAGMPHHNTDLAPNSDWILGEDTLYSDYYWSIMGALGSDVKRIYPQETTCPLVC